VLSTREIIFGVVGFFFSMQLDSVILLNLFLRVLKSIVLVPPLIEFLADFAGCALFGLSIFAFKKFSLIFMFDYFCSPRCLYDFKTYLGSKYLFDAEF
jgi:hypothetical protein